jgi:WD40 repeat protein
MILSGH